MRSQIPECPCNLLAADQISINSKNFQPRSVRARHITSVRSPRASHARAPAPARTASPGRARRIATTVDAGRRRRGVPTDSGARAPLATLALAGETMQTVLKLLLAGLAALAAATDTTPMELSCEKRVQNIPRVIDEATFQRAVRAPRPRRNAPRPRPPTPASRPLLTGASTFRNSRSPSAPCQISAVATP